MKVEFRIHGPYRHRRQWRLDIFDQGKRSKMNFVSYREALLAAHETLTARGGERPGNDPQS